MAHRDETRILRQSRLDAGLCAWCGDEPLIEGRKHGARCKARAASKRAKLRATGKCHRCPNPAPKGRRLCPACVLSSRAGLLATSRPTRINVCSQCGQPDHNRRSCPQGRYRGRGRLVDQIVSVILALREPRTRFELADETRLKWRTAYRIVEQLRDAGVPISEVEKTTRGTRFEIQKEALRIFLRL